MRLGSWMVALGLLAVGVSVWAVAVNRMGLGAVAGLLGWAVLIAGVVMRELNRE